MTDETNPDLPSAEWPDLSSAQTLASNQERSTLATGDREMLEGKILRIDAQIEIMGNRVDELAGGLSDSSNAVPDGLEERLNGIERQIAAARARFQTFSTQLDASTETLEGSKQSTDDDLSNLTNQVDQALIGLAELKDLVGTNDSLIQTHDSGLQSFASKFTVVERSIQDLNTRLEKAAETAETAETASASSLELAQTVDVLTEKVDTRAHGQAQNAVDIRSLQDRALRMEKAHETYTTKVVEHVNLAHRRLTQSSNEISSIQARLEGDKTGADTKIAELDSKLEAYNVELRSLLQTIEEATTSIDNRFSEQGTQVNDHKSTLDSATGLLAKHDELVQANIVSISSIETRADGQADALNLALESIEASLLSTQRIDGALGAATRQINDVSIGVDTTNRDVEALAGRAEANDTAVSRVAERFELAEQATAAAIAAAIAASDQTNSALAAASARIDEIEPLVEEQTELTDLHTQQITAVNDWVTIVDKRTIDMAEQEGTTQTQISAVNDWVTVVDKRTIDMASSLTASLEQVESVNERVADLDGRMSETVERFDQLDITGTIDEALVGRLTEFRPILGNHTTQLDAVNEWASIADDRMVEIEQRTNELESLHSATKEQLEEQLKELSEVEKRAAEQAEANTPFAADEVERLRNSITTVKPSVDTHSLQIEALNDWVVEVDRRINELREIRSTADQKTEAIEDWTTALDGRILDIQAAAENTSMQIDAIDQWSISTDSRLDELTRLDAELSERIEQSATGTQAQINEVVASTNRDIGSLNEQLTMTSDQLFTTNEKLAARSQQFEQIEAETASTQEQVAEINRLVAVASNDLDQLRSSGIAVEKTIESTTERTDALENHASETDDRLLKAQDALNKIATDLADVKQNIDDGAGQTASVVSGQSRPEDQLSTSQKEMQQKVDAAEQSVQSLQESIQSQINAIEQANSQTNNDLRENLVYRIDAVEDRIERRISDVERSGSDGERLAGIEREVEKADERARDAQAFSENLRLLQTDLVKALQSELAVQADRIARLELLLSQR